MKVLTITVHSMVKESLIHDMCVHWGRVYIEVYSSGSSYTLSAFFGTSYRKYRWAKDLENMKITIHLAKKLGMQ